MSPALTSSTHAPKPTNGSLAHVALQEGDVLAGRYRIDALVRGRFAAVLCFDATDISTSTRVTVHLLLARQGQAWTPSSESNPLGVLGSSPHDLARSSFLRGAQRAKELRGPHVARVLDAGVTLEGHAWIVREHLASTTLNVHLQENGAMLTADAVDVALAVCDAIAEAHRHDMVHGSIGPHAVHVDLAMPGSPEVKVTGAGTASAEAALTLGAPSDVECILRSPEQLRTGATMDVRSDVWAIGVLLHTMLAGASPFAADTPSGASLSVVIDDPPSLAGVPDELADVVERALAKEAHARPASVLDLADALASFATDPAAAREKIKARRLQPAPLENERMPSASFIPVAIESHPTLVVERKDYAALAHEQAASPTPPPSSVDVDVHVETNPALAADTIRDRGRDPIRLPMSTLAPTVSPSASTSLPKIPTAARVPAFLFTGGPRSISRELPTVITRTAPSPRRRLIKIMGLATAAASVALLVLVGTEGARLSRHAKVQRPLEPKVTVAAATPAANQEPPPAVEAMPAPAPTPTPSHPTATTSAAKKPAARVAASPASKPSSAPDDDLRRFLDDRR